MIINPFNDVPDQPIPVADNNSGQDVLSNVSAIQIGKGARAFKADESGIWLGAKKWATAPFRVDMQGNLTATSATITGLAQNFVSTIVWTATDRDTASWSAGTIKTSDETTYTISSGNTGNILATTYIFLNPAVSTTVLQTTTTATSAAGDGIILIAIVQIGAVGSECIITVIGSNGTTIDGAKIVTGSVVASAISVTSLSAISANLGTITAGSISIGSGNTILKIDSSGNMWSGHATQGSAPFQVTNAGVMSLSGPSSSISIGTANAIFKADSNGIYLGNATFASAPFSVDMNGGVIMASWTLKTPDTATSIVGVNTGIGGGGILFPNNSGAYFKDAAGTLRGGVYMTTGDILRLANTTGQTSITAGNVIGLLMYTDGSILMGYGVSITSGLSVSTGNLTMGTGSITSSGSSIDIASGKNLTFLGTQGSINCGNIDCDAIAMNDHAITGVTAMTCKSITLSNGQSEGNVEAVDTIKGYNDLRLQVGTATGADAKVRFNNSSGTEKAHVDVENGKYYAANLGGGATNCTIDANGYIIRDPSDAVLKDNIVELEKKNSLDLLMSLRPVNFNWIDKKRFGKDKAIGFLAQDLEKVFPEVVSTGGEYKSVDYSKLIAPIVSAMQEMNGRLATLESKASGIIK